jgi:hypothetical protein
MQELIRNVLLYMGTPNLSCVCNIRGWEAWECMLCENFDYSSCFGMKQSDFKGCTEQIALKRAGELVM